MEKENGFVSRAMRFMDIRTKHSGAPSARIYWSHKCSVERLHGRFDGHSADKV